MVFSEFENGIRFSIKVKTKASKNKIEDMGDYLLVSIKAVPIKGKANKEIIKLLSKQFDIRSADIQIVSGMTAKLKIIEIKNVKLEDLKTDKLK